jgi:hypothetical protein
MARPLKKERNAQIVALRNKNPGKYSFGVLAEMFKIRKETVFEIYQRESARLAR